MNVLSHVILIIIHLTHVIVWESMGESLVAACSLYKWDKLDLPINVSSHVILIITYRTRDCMGVNGKALQLHAVYIKSCKNPYQVLPVTCSDCAMKSKVNMIKSLSPQYQAILEKYHSLHKTGTRFSPYFVTVRFVVSCLIIAWQLSRRCLCTFSEVGLTLDWLHSAEDIT